MICHSKISFSLLIKLYYFLLRVQLRFELSQILRVIHTHFLSVVIFFRSQVIIIRITQYIVYVTTSPLHRINIIKTYNFRTDMTMRKVLIHAIARRLPYMFGVQCICLPTHMIQFIYFIQTRQFAIFITFLLFLACLFIYSSMASNTCFFVTTFPAHISFMPSVLSLLVLRRRIAGLTDQSL